MVGRYSAVSAQGGASEFGDGCVGGGCPGLGGGGEGDMKGGLVAAWWAVSALQRSEMPLRGDVLLARQAG